MIFILDQQQAEISLSSMMRGEIGQVEEIRVTVHDLRVHTSSGLVGR